MTKNPDRLSLIRFRREVQHHLAWSLHSFLLGRLAARQHRSEDQEYWNHELRRSLSCSLPTFIDWANYQNEFDVIPTVEAAVQRIFCAADAHIARSIISWERWQQTSVMPEPVAHDFSEFLALVHQEIGCSCEPSPQRYASTEVLAMGTDRSTYRLGLQAQFFQIEVHYLCVLMMRKLGTLLQDEQNWASQLNTFLLDLARDMLNKGEFISNPQNVFKEALKRYAEHRGRKSTANERYPKVAAVKKVEIATKRKVPRSIVISIDDGAVFDRTLQEFADVVYRERTEDGSIVAAERMVVSVGRTAT